MHSQLAFGEWLPGKFTGAGMPTFSFGMLLSSAAQCFFRREGSCNCHLPLLRKATTGRVGSNYMSHLSSSPPPPAPLLTPYVTGQFLYWFTDDMYIPQWSLHTRQLSFWEDTHTQKAHALVIPIMGWHPSQNNEGEQPSQARAKECNGNMTPLTHSQALGNHTPAWCLICSVLSLGIGCQARPSLVNKERIQTMEVRGGLFESLPKPWDRLGLQLLL